MSVTLNIIADNAEALVAEFRKLNALTAYEAALDTDVLAVVKSLPLDEMINLVRERMRDEGFKLEIIDQRDQSPPASPPETQPEAIAAPEPAEPKTRGRPRKTNGAAPEVITEPGTAADEDITLPRSKKASKASPMPLDAPEPDPDPAGDRQHVLDTLASILKDPKQKDRVLGFASGMAKQHGKDKISELPVDPFPEIRRAMEKEFSNA